ncbi:transporter [Rhizobium rhizosphaerae]|uniref:Transporter n=1 Tax=Xaviernesmea rhizosphaerae TaxID=1672749 RepID=A0A1Q9AC58_9HYPH|nr:RbsD/FucU family protein [Xaviernesmea rhizosphaerae]OLP52476.1 transporter [Xaviernesmea rhizosphaerae]OQP84233.1 transporter [Xaviernesmea rhizosphaerae]
MLKGLNPLLSPELLATLRAMGHGDEIAVVDGNYPGLEHARRLIRLDGHALVPVIDAILSVMPIDDFVPEAIFRSTVKQDRDLLDPVHEEMIACCARHEPNQPVVPLIGEAFYGRVKAAHTIVQTGEPRLYANMILRKGVIYP